MATVLDNPFSLFTDRKGDALDQGYVYVGEASQDPELFPIDLFWDEDLTIPAAQPLRTVAGYIVNPGAGNSPANVFFAPGEYSIRIRDRQSVQVFYAAIASNLAALLSSPNGSSLVGFLQSGTGAIARTVQDKLRERISAKDFGAVADGVADDATALLDAAIAARIAMTDGLRVFAGEIRLGPGRYLINDVLDLADLVDGVTGITISGAGAGSTEIVFDGSTATIKCRGSRAVTFRDVGFVSSGVDDNQIAFTIDYDTIADPAPLRSWRFERCDWAAFFTCFKVTGVALCSEFYFDKCQFSQCYYLMDNENGQAVNWNFTDCNWENGELTTIKNKTLAAALNLKAGTNVYWRGGSMIVTGKLVYYNLTDPGVFLTSSHRITFDGIRTELVPESGSSKTPLIDRVASGYVSGSNSPATSMINCSLLQRDPIPTGITYANVWPGCSLFIDNCEFEGGFVTGILESATSAVPADVVINATSGLEYQEDITNRLNDHDQNNVTIIPKRRDAASIPALNWRLCSLSIGASLQPFRLKYRGPTGSMPLGGTTINIPPFPDHVEFLTLGGRRFAAGAQTLTIELRDQADTTTYGTATFSSGAQLTASGDINKEMGFQIPTGTPLMLKFTGTPEIVKGFVYIDYQ